MPTNVVEAWARIMAELPAIAKKRHPESDGISYPYRGIEEITAEAQVLFAKYGVVPIPYKTTPIGETRWFTTKNGTTWSDEKIKIHWRIYGPGGLDDMMEAQTLGIGRDNSDKGFNKAATQALKYLLLPALLISDKNDDADGTTVIDDSTSLVAPPSGAQSIGPRNGNGLSAQRKSDIAKALNDLDPPVRGKNVPAKLGELLGRDHAVALTDLTLDDGRAVFAKLSLTWPDPEPAPAEPDMADVAGEPGPDA